MPKKMIYAHDGHKDIVNVVAFVHTSFGTMNAVWKAVGECGDTQYHQDPAEMFHNVE